MSTKTLIIKERKHVWAILIEVVSPYTGRYKDELATFAKRPMSLCAMASSVNAFKEWLRVDYVLIDATKEGVEALKIVGIYTPEINDAEGDEK